MANVVFLWHMHQPYYVDPSTQAASMPWVRLHCVKGYLDMISVIEEFPGIRVNFNLTPVLVLQIRELVEGRIHDEWLELSRVPAVELDEREKFALLENFFKINWDNQVRPYPRFRELLAKRGLTFYRDEVRRNLRYFSTHELRDLQVWFNLAWCGFTAEQMYPELAALKRKGRHFTEDEKLRVLEIHEEIMRLILAKYRAAEERGQAELTTTPFFHPILPLVYDSALAERSLPGRIFPKRFHWPDDAAAQLSLAMDQHAAVFGRRPRGLWPSEGSIAPELIPLMEQAGFEYFCSDEDNLFHSLRQDPATRGRATDHLELFQGWQVWHEGVSVNALFREKPLSDFIGFNAAKNDARQGAQHLLHHLKHISEIVPPGDGIIPIILDGENAWETFADGGQAFLRALYGGIQAEPEALHSCTIEDYFRHHPPKRKISALHTGSWIGSNFDVWIGEADENRAWELLGETRGFLQRKIESGALTPDLECRALREIYAAEGSDWFWWYGPDFSSDNQRFFDDLFRKHLKSVYTLCGALAPAALDEPIDFARTARLYRSPRGPVSPTTDGKRATFYEWNGAGLYTVEGGPRGHARNHHLAKRILFGHDSRNLYLRVDLHHWEPVALEVAFQQPAPATIRTEPITRGDSLAFTIARAGAKALKRNTLAAAETIEMAIALKDLGLVPGAPVSFRLRILQDGAERERHPENVPIEFAIAGEERALENWFV